MSRILVVEDNADLVFALRSTLQMDGHEVEAAMTGPDGVERALELQPDLVILDVMLPGFDGFRVLRTLREKEFQAPVLFLTARGEEEDKVRGFRLGADDYVTKPFGAMELLARVEVLLRRARRDAAGAAPNGGEAQNGARAERFGALEINLKAHTVKRDGVPVALRPKEYELLAALVQRRGTVVTREELLRDVWHYRDDVTSRTIDIHVAELRRKLEEDPQNPRHLVTVRKVGLRFEP
jgi:two-component system, OmpR family, alkaline phosphatase synthesis response regulator PhoP